MANATAMSIFQHDGTTPDELAIAYTSLVDQIQKAALANRYKNTNISQDPVTGTYKARRLETSAVQNYGTARAAGEGTKIKNNGVDVPVNTPKEIIEEVEQFDLDQYGLAGMITRRTENFKLSMARFLDNLFFAKAISAGASVDLSGISTVEDKLLSIINSLETVQNTNVDGVDRELMVMSVKPYWHSQVQKLIYATVNPAGQSVKMFHDVEIVSNMRQTADVVIQVKGSVALPVIITDFKTETIPLSTAQALELFFKYGVEAVMPDLIFYGTLGTIPSV